MHRCFVVGWVLAATGFTLAGCDVERLINDITKSSKTPPTASISADGLTNVGKTETTIAVGSFNIQVLGQSKLQKPKAMDVLAKVVRRFDVIAIQELRSKDQDVIPRFLELINEDGSRFDFIIGPRLGRTTSKEQYVFLYDTRRIEVVPGSVYSAADPGDQLHREPLVATFRVRNSGASSSAIPFSFTLINIHTDPDETDWELDALAEVYTRVQQDRIREDDVILLGDLNVDERHLGKMGRVPGILWAIADQPTNTRGTESYDNILFDREKTREFTGQAGVLNLQKEYGLSEGEALEVSDHYPIWAAFHGTENTHAPPIASRPVNRR